MNWGDAPAPTPVQTRLASGKWQVQVFFGRKSFFLGAFDSQPEATAAYERAKERSGSFVKQFSAQSRDEVEQNMLRHLALDDIKLGQQKKKGEGSSKTSEKRSTKSVEASIKARSHGRGATAPAKTKGRILAGHALKEGGPVGYDVAQRVTQNGNTGLASNSPNGAADRNNQPLTSSSVPGNTKNVLLSNKIVSPLEPNQRQLSNGSNSNSEWKRTVHSASQASLKPKTDNSSNGDNFKKQQPTSPDRVLRGAPPDLSKKVSAEAAKVKGSASSSKGGARGEPLPSKGTSTAENDAASPKEGGAAKRKFIDDDDPMSAKNARRRTECRVAECTNCSVQEGVCCRHRARRKLCANDWCPNLAGVGSVCVKHESKNGQPTKVPEDNHTANPSGVTSTMDDAKTDGLGLLCSAMEFTSNEGNESLPEKGANSVVDKGVHVSHVETAKKDAVEGCNIGDAHANGGLGPFNGAEEKCMIEATTKNEEGQQSTMYPLDDDFDDELGTLVYKSSFTAKVRVEEVKSSSFARDDPRDCSARSPGSLSLDCAMLSQSSENVERPKSSGTLEGFEEVNKKAAKNARSLPSVAEAKETSLECQIRNPKAKLNSTAEPMKVSVQRLDRFDIYYIFERLKLIQSEVVPVPSATDTDELRLLEAGCNVLNIPVLPPRFAHVKVPPGWYIYRDQELDIEELSKLIAASWMEIDDETLKWTVEVEMILKRNQPKLDTQVKILAKLAKKVIIMAERAESESDNSAKQAAQAQVANKAKKEAARSPDMQIAEQPTKTSVTPEKALSNGTDLLENTLAVKNFAGDELLRDGAPCTARTTHNQGVLLTNLKSPSLVTSNYEPPHLANLRNVVHLRDATRNENIHRARHNDKHVGLQAEAVFLPNASTASPASREESRAYSKSHTPISGVASREVLPNTDAAHDDTVGDLKKYFFVMKCAQMLQNKAMRELQRRIVPRLSHLSHSTSNVDLQQQQQPCFIPGLPVQATAGYRASNRPRYDSAHLSHSASSVDRQQQQHPCFSPGLPVPATAGDGASNRPCYDAAFAARRMAGLKQLERALEAEQVRRMIERARSASGGDPHNVAGREEGWGSGK